MIVYHRSIIITFNRRGKILHLSSVDAAETKLRKREVKLPDISTDNE